MVTPRDKPEVTVVIPTRNRWHRLRRTLAGALAQEGVALEVILVDDASAERMPADLGATATGDSRLRVVRNDAGLGLAGARNRGIAESRGTWIAFLDDDDLWAPRKLRAQLDAADAAGAAWAYAAAIELDERARPIAPPEPPPVPEDVARLLLVANAIPAGSSNVLVRTDVVQRLGGFDEHLTQLADWDLWLRLAAAEPATACTEVLVGYVLHSENMIHTDPGGVIGEFERLGAKHRKASDAAGVEFDAVRVFRWIAWSHRRAGKRRSAAAAYLRAAFLQRSLGDVPRAVGALAGERAFGVKRRLALRDVTEPTWLELYR